MNTLRLVQIQTFRCSVCYQLHDEERQLEVAQVVKLCGAKQFSVCICCGLDVQHPENVHYQRRWIRWARRQINERLAELRQILKNTKRI